MAPPDDSKPPTKISINGSSTNSAGGFNPNLQDQITMALLQSGGIKRIQTSFSERLDESGWSQALRDYVERLFRSGEVSNFDEAIRNVMGRVRLDETLENGAQQGGVKGNNNLEGAMEGDLRIPRDAARDAAGIVRRELRGVVKMGGGEGDGGK